MKHPLDHYIGFRLIQILKRHRTQVEPVLNDLGLYPGQEMVLFLLWRKEGLTQSELGERWGVDPSTVTKSLQRLQNAGFIERRQDPDDGRVYRVYLTPKGRELEKPVQCIWDEAEATVTGGLSDVEKALLMRLLDQMLSNYSK